MKTLYESLLTGNVRKPSVITQAQSRKDLEQLIKDYIDTVKPHPGQEVGLNWIDISKVDDLSFLFERTNYIPIIDKWKIDQVQDFRYMFAYNKHIVRSPLPRLQTKLYREYCYDSMFAGCSSLVEPPELPATNLTRGCYEFMFANCSSLKKSPELPAMNLARACYWSMFSDCTSLETPPELPATQLVYECYKYMFMGCKSLRRCATVPVEVIISSLYGDDMYRGCSRIKHKKPPINNIQ